MLRKVNMRPLAKSEGLKAVRPHSSLGYRPPAPEGVPSPVPPSGSASLHLRPTLAMEVTMH